MNIIHNKVELRVPLSKLHYDAKSFSFNWNEVILTIPYTQQSLTVRDGHLLEGFKDNLKGEITIRFRWHRTRHQIDEIKVLDDGNALMEINDVTSRVNNLISEMKSLIASGTLNMNEARGVMTKSKLKYNDEIIHRILMDIIRRMPGQKIEVELQFPLSQLYYDAKGFWFKWNETWLAVPYTRMSSKIQSGHLLEFLKDSFKNSITIHIFWNRVFQYIDDIQLGTSLAASKEIDNISSRIEKCISEIQSLAVERTLSFEQARTIFSEKELECDDKKIQEILSEIIDKIELHTDAESFEVPLSDIEYSSYDITFHKLGTSFQVDEDELPFELGPILEKIKSELEGSIIFHINRDCVIKWDSRNARLLVGDVRMERERVEIIPETLKSFKDLRSKMICDAINALERETTNIEQVKSILKEWGLSLTHREICLKIVEVIPKWNMQLSLQMPADQVEYSSYGIKVTSGHGQKIFIPSKELPFGTCDVLEGIKGILEGIISINIRYSEGFVWDETEERLTIEQDGQSYEVTVDDEFLESLEFIDVPFVHPSESESGSIPGPTRDDSHGDPRKLGYYKPECVRFLKTLVEQAKGHTYITSVDLWYKIDGILIWERPKYSAATYIFSWPDIPLKTFIYTTWSTPLETTRYNRETSRYKNRVIHDHDYGLDSWKANLSEIIREYTGVQISYQ